MGDATQVMGATHQAPPVDNPSKHCGSGLNFQYLAPLTMIDKEIDELIFSRASGCISTVLDDETVILDMDSGNYSGLNEVGTAVWSLLEKEVAFADISQSILGEFEVSAEECAEHLKSFLKELADSKLIEVRLATNS